MELNDRWSKDLDEASKAERDQGLVSINPDEGWPKDPHQQAFSYRGFVWDVDAAARLAAGKGRPARIRVGALLPLLKEMHIDERYAMSAAVDLTRPLIAVRLSGISGVLVIDGWHRVYKAAEKKVYELPCIVLNETEEAMIRLAGSIDRIGRDE